MLIGFTVKVSKTTEKFKHFWRLSFVVALRCVAWGFTQLYGALLHWRGSAHSFPRGEAVERSETDEERRPLHSSFATG